MGLSEERTIPHEYTHPRYRFARPGANRYNASGIGACAARRAISALAET